eukprot:5252987-Prymnesium_polylepis.1
MSPTPTPEPRPPPPPPCCELELHDACVAYEHDAPPMRRVLLMQANASAAGGWEQRRFLGEFREGSGYPFKGRSRDEPVDTDAAYMHGPR